MTISRAASLLLATDELRDLSGYRNHALQVRWLVANSIPHFLDSSGRPRVLRRTIEQRLGFSEDGNNTVTSATSTPREVASRARPNFTSLLDATPRNKAWHGS